MIANLSPSDRSKYACALHASKLVESGMKVGLGTGSTAYWLVHHLAERVRKEDLKFVGVPTSTRTRDQAHAEGIRLISMDDAGRLDITIDGAEWLKGAGQFNHLDMITDQMWDMFEMMRNKK